jgi:DNA-binding NarL/FixJ family response regulator
MTATRPVRPIVAVAGQGATRTDPTAAELAGTAPVALRTNVVVASQTRVYRDAIGSLLAAHPGLAVLRGVASRRELHDVAASQRAHVALVDLPMLGAPRDVAALRERAAALARRLQVLAAQQGPPALDPGLTTRERQVLGLLEQGLTNNEIAAELVIALPTAKNHVHHILDKLGARGRAEAVVIARRLRA